jgi:hypothetical protein
VLFGAMTVGSVAWGEIADAATLPLAHYLAAVGALIAIPLTWRSKLQTGARLDLTPSMSWPEPVIVDDLQERAGPVMVQVDYHVANKDHDAFLIAIDRLALERRRDGAYAWGVFEDASEPGHFVETFLVESWEEHLRQHERVTKADVVLQERVEALLTQPAKVTHLISAQRRRRSDEGDTGEPS